MIPPVENQAFEKLTRSLRDYDEVKWQSLFYDLFRVGTAALPVKLPDEEPSVLLAALFELLALEKPLQEDYLRALLAFYDHLVAKRDYPRDEAYFVELHWFFGATKPPGAFKTLFRVLNEERFRQSPSNGEFLHVNLLTIVKDLCPSDDKRQLVADYLHRRIPTAATLAFYRVAFSFFHKNLFEDYYFNLAGQYLEKIEKAEENARETLAESFLEALREYEHSHGFKGIFTWFSRNKFTYKEQSPAAFRVFRRKIKEWLHYNSEAFQKPNPDPYGLMLLAAVETWTWQPVRLLRDLAAAAVDQPYLSGEVAATLSDFLQEEHKWTKQNYDNRIVPEVSRYRILQDNKLILSIDKKTLVNVAISFQLPEEKCDEIFLTLEEAEFLDGIFAHIHPVPNYDEIYLLKNQGFIGDSWSGLMPGKRFTGHWKGV